MNQSIKNILGIVAMIAIAAGTYAAVTIAKVYDRSSEPTSFRSFSVSAEGKSVSVPDVARFTYSVVTEGGLDVAALQRQNTEKMNRTIAFVKGVGVDEEDIRTQSYNVSPRYQYSRCVNNGACPPPEITGYTVSQTVEVTIRNFEHTSPLLSGVVREGANQVSQLYFTIDDPTEAEQEARKEAIQKAQDKAEEVARAGGFNVGRLLTIEEGHTPPVIPIGRYQALDAAQEDAPMPVIEPGSQETFITVTLTYEIR